MDYINIKNLEVFSKHGVFDEENRLGQKYSIDCMLYLDARKAGLSDSIDKTVHYGKVCHFINAFMKGHSFKLIESAAERLAEDILIEYPILAGLNLTIKKPWAPVGLPIEEVAVSIERRWHKAFISMGSNMGDREIYLNNAIAGFKENDKIRFLNESTIIETEPYGMEEQAKFLNNVIEIETLFTPEELLQFCKALEKKAGRVKTEHWGPRPLDADILFYDRETIDTKELTIPHYDMCNRAFVLEPLNEIASYYRHPVFNKTVGQMLSELNNR